MNSCFRSIKYSFWGLVLLGMAASGSVRADTGEPMGAGPGGTFSIRITHGGTVLVDNPAVPFPADIRTPAYDGDPEDSTVIGFLNGNAGKPIALKITTDDLFGTIPATRIMHFYVDSPSLADSLFDPNDASHIKVEIGNIKFGGTATAMPFVDNTNSFFTSYFLTAGPGTSLYYQTPQSNAYNSYLHGNFDVQVPGEAYRDGNLSQYVFNGVPGAVVSWSWEEIVNPGLAGVAIDNAGGASVPGGGVFELGLGVAFKGTLVPEPGTLALLGGAMIALMRRRGR